MHRGRRPGHGLAAPGRWSPPRDHPIRRRAGPPEAL